MDTETKSLIFVTYGDLIAAKARQDKGAAEMVNMFERHLTTLGFLDENKVLTDPIGKEQVALSTQAQKRKAIKCLFTRS